nr:transposase [Mesorhizobium sp. SARCC-RB16n]
MTLPGLDVTVAASVAAAIGDIRRFSDPQKLVAYLGLNPSVRQSGAYAAATSRWRTRPNRKNAVEKAAE